MWGQKRPADSIKAHGRQRFPEPPPSATELFRIVTEPEVLSGRLFRSEHKPCVVPTGTGGTSTARRGRAAVASSGDIRPKGRDATHTHIRPRLGSRQRGLPTD